MSGRNMTQDHAIPQGRAGGGENSNQKNITLERGLKTI